MRIRLFGLLLMLAAYGEEMKLTSVEFVDGGIIPQRFTCQGGDTSPALKWANAPTETKSFALIIDDIDANGFTHWIVFNIPSTANEMPENLPVDLDMGTNDFQTGNDKYRGPCPPNGPHHRYVFTLYALDVEKIDLYKPTKAQLLQAMEGHILRQAVLTGRYQRQ